MSETRLIDDRFLVAGHGAVSGSGTKYEHGRYGGPNNSLLALQRDRRWASSDFGSRRRLS